jgi:hypothetical protein
MLTRETKSRMFNISERVHEMMQTINVQFYNARGVDEAVLNRVVSFLDPPYCHCEIEFMDSVACAIYWGGKVHMKNRSFNPTNYDCIQLDCPRPDYERALTLARQKSLEGEVFNLRQMLGSKIPLLRASTEGTFCSKLCAELLVAARLLPADANVEQMTPSSLFHRLSSSQESAPLSSDVIVALDFAS